MIYNSALKGSMSAYMDIEWAKRSITLQEKTNQLWNQLVSIIGEGEIRHMTGKSVIESPNLLINNKYDLSAYTPRNSTSVYLGKLWLLDVADLPSAWKDMSYSVAEAIFESFFSTSISETDLMCFMKATQSGQESWEKIRTAAIAHELAHVAGCQSNYLGENFSPCLLSDRVCELEADRYAVKIGEPIREGLLKYFSVQLSLCKYISDIHVETDDAHRLFEYHNQQMDITKQTPSEISPAMHPTWKTRIEALTLKSV